MADEPDSKSGALHWACGFKSHLRHHLFSTTYVVLCTCFCTKRRLKFFSLNHFQNGRVGEMNLVLNSGPANLQPFAKMAFLDRLPTTKRLEGVPTIQFLNDAATGLRKSSISEFEKYDWFFGLLKLTLRYQRSEAIAVFKEAIASLNRATTENSKFLDSNQFAEFLPASLLEIDEFAVKETLASVTNVEARAQLRLQLLKQIQTRAR